MLPTITVVGNLKRLETRFIANGKQVTKFQIECAEKNAKGEYVNLYLGGEVWEKQAEFVNNYFNEGSHAIVTGKLYTNVYEKDGKKVYENRLLFPKVDFVPKDKSDGMTQGRDNAQQQQQGQAYQPQGAGQANKEYQAQTQPKGGEVPQYDIDESEIPFNGG